MKKTLMCLTLGLAATGGALALRPAIGAKADDISEEPAISEPAPIEEANPLDEFVKEYFSADKVAMYMSWIAYVGTIVGLVANVTKLKKANTLTLKNVSDEVQSKLKEVVGAEVGTQIQEFLPAIVATQRKTNDALTIFSKILALSQENSPEARVAILDLIAELGNVGKEIVDSAKEAIEKEVAEIEEKKEEIERRLDEIIDTYDGTSI